MKKLIICLLSVLWIGPTLYAQSKAFKYRKVIDNTVNEVSGMVIYHPDSIALINDSGDQAILYTINAKGKLLHANLIQGIQNKDWEALATDGQTLFIADFGNNCNCRKDLKIYRLHPDQGIDSIEFSLEDQQLFPPQKSEMRYDLEALAYSNGQLHIFSKNKIGHGDYISNHYTLNNQAGKQVAKKVNSLLIPDLVVTGAAFNSTGTELLMMAYNYKRLLGIFPYSTSRLIHFSEIKNQNVFEAKMQDYRIGPLFLLGQYESVDWIDEQNALIASERTLFIRPRMKKIRLKKRK